jgi:threonylcarbamoyladenosine tRNA methylthiotransferase MtaB
MATFYIEQFGCRATQADGAAIERQLRDRGLDSAREAAAADIVVLNTCTVTASADAQARDAIRKLHAANPAIRVIVTGCYAQRAPEELAALPGVSWVVGNSHKPQIPQLADSLWSAALTVPTPPTSSVIDFFPAAALHSDATAPLHSFVGAQHAVPHQGKILTGNIFDHPEFLSAPVLGGEGNHTRPTLKIQDGCNSRCSFCVIPFVRGKSRSLPPESVIQEIQRLSESGYREIVLSGINLGTYGRDLSPRVEFEDVLRRILAETSVERLRISSIESLDVTQDLVDLFAGSDRIAQHFHMPLQSGSNRILAAMHRWYRAEHYARRVELVRERLPHAAIGADVIAGFPGETQADHAATLSFIDSLPFTYLHVFSYSKRPGTTAARLPNQVPGATIKRRARTPRSRRKKIPRLPPIPNWPHPPRPHPPS